MQTSFGFGASFFRSETLPAFAVYFHHAVAARRASSSSHSSGSTFGSPMPRFTESGVARALIWRMSEISMPSSRSAKRIFKGRRRVGLLIAVLHDERRGDGEVVPLGEGALQR